MRKVVFSPITKVIAFILAVACIVLCVNTVVDAAAQYEKEETYIYDFETRFEDTDYFAWMLQEPAWAVADGIYAFNKSTDKKALSVYITDMLNRLQNDDKIDYSVTVNGTTFTNCWEEKEYFEQARFFYILERDENGEIIGQESYNKRGSYSADYYWSNTSLDFLYDNFAIYASVKESYVQEFEPIWQRQADYIWGALTEIAILAGVALLLIIYLIAVAGKTADGEYKPMWLDSIWTEVHLAVIGGAGVGAAALCVYLSEEFLSGRLSLDIARLFVLVLAGFAGALIINSILSLVRKIKCRTFLKTSVIFIVLRWLFKALGKVFRMAGKAAKKVGKLFYSLLTKKSGLLLILVMLVYTALMAIFGVCLTYDKTAAVGIILGLILFVFVCLVFAHRARELGEIKIGVEEIKGGNLTYNIPELKSSDLNNLAVNINEIAVGLDESVSAKVKAERMKTELITNVSHDLKTPLTSIINYAELLNNAEGLPEEAKDYAQIIAKKSDRLKRLTQDLFDISRIQSGNEEITFEKIDISLLVNQSLGEHDSEIKKSELNFCVNLEKELFICADGRKMSRVISNLISNILKYAMKNTRVFVTTSTQGDNAIIELKNISTYPMDFDAQEIMGRFVRGDKSRTVEGNGLGLAIVHSYTEACGGKFEIVTDGDLFKAIITFPKIK